MDLITLLETGSPEEQLAFFRRRFQANLEFFAQAIPDFVPLLKEPPRRYRLAPTPVGPNLFHMESGEPVYPFEEGRSRMVEICRGMAHNPAANPAWTPCTNETRLRPLNDQEFPLTARLCNTVLGNALEDPDFDGKTLHFGGQGFLPTVTLLGLLSGLQLELLRRQFGHIHSLLVYEPEPDFFKASCQLVDYPALFAQTPEHSCHLFIRGHLPTGGIRKFFDRHLITNSYLRLEQKAYDDPRLEDGQRLLAEAQRQITRGWGTFEDEMVGVRNRLAGVDPEKPKEPFLARPVNCGVPVCVVGNGPSLNGLIPFLKAHREKMVILSAGTALKPLMAAGVKPDFQVEIERRRYLAEVVKDSPIDDVPLLAADLLHPETVGVARTVFRFVRDATTTAAMHDPALKVPFSSPVVGNAALALALHMSDTVYLCGLDAGFKEDGKQHAKGSFYDDRDDESKEKFPTRGNFSANVYTNSLFSLSREIMEAALAHAPDRKVYNLSDGAYIKGAEPKRAAELKVPGKEKAKALTLLKTAFQTTGFFRSPEKNYDETLKEYKKQMVELLKSAAPKSKPELFRLVDYAFYATTLQRRNEPVSGTLLSGTFWHTLYYLFVALVHVKREDLSELTADLAEKIETILEEATLGFIPPSD